MVVVSQPQVLTRIVGSTLSCCNLSLYYYIIKEFKLKSSPLNKDTDMFVLVVLSYRYVGLDLYKDFELYRDQYSYWHDYSNYAAPCAIKILQPICSCQGSSGLMARTHYRQYSCNHIYKDVF